ncbi:UNVERIFIED_CONTAM: hypothetical protein EX528_00770 [Xanthomonas axonopodis]
MAASESNLLENHEWVVTLYPPGRRELAFAGLLKYSPTEGLWLHYAIPHGFLPDDDIDCLHGCTSSGDRCTLIGKFKPYSPGHSFKHGHTYSKGRARFSYYVLGIHCADLDTFDSFTFNLAGVENFFGHASYRRRSELPSGPVHSARYESGSLEIQWHGKLEVEGVNIIDSLHSTDPDALEKLRTAFLDISSAHPGFHVYYKKEIDYSFHFRPDEDLQLRDGYAIGDSIANLFALLSFAPIMMKDFYAIARDENGRPVSLPVFHFHITEKDTLSRILKAVDQPPYALEIADIDFGKVLKGWSEKKNLFSTMISRIQCQGLLVANHDVLAGIVLSATQLENIGFLAQKGPKEKYQYPVDRYASKALKERLRILLSCSAEEIGISIGHLRNDIAHVGKPKKILNKLSFQRQNITQLCLEVLVISYVLSELGVEDDSLKKFQGSLLPLAI